MMAHSLPHQAVRCWSKPEVFTVDKRPIFAAWRSELETRSSAAHAGQLTARAGTRVDGSHRPANRGERGAVTAQGYLALGLGQRAAELAEHLRLLDEVGFGPRETLVVGAVGQIQITGQSCKTVAVVPGGDATWLDIELEAEQLRVQYLSAASPLIRQLRECCAGDADEIELCGKILLVEVLSIL